MKIRRNREKGGGGGGRAVVNSHQMPPWRTDSCRPVKLYGPGQPSSPHGATKRGENPVNSSILNVYLPFPNWKHNLLSWNLYDVTKRVTTLWVCSYICRGAIFLLAPKITHTKNIRTFNVGGGEGFFHIIKFLLCRKLVFLHIFTNLI